MPQDPLDRIIGEATHHGVHYSKGTTTNDMPISASVCI